MLSGRVLTRFSIQSKLIIMLVLCAILATAIVAAIAFRTGRATLRTAAFDRLTEIRETQARTLQDTIADLSSALISYTHSGHARDALRDFSAGFDQLRNAQITPADEQRIVDYYTNVFIPQTEKTSGNRLDVGALLPTSNAQRYLQAVYTSRRQNDDVAITIDDARDGSAWSAANARYQDYFREIVTRFEFEDALLINARGDVVYSAYKDVDLGTNILNGPFLESKLHDAFTQAMSSNQANRVVFTDFEFYEPAEMSPTAWMVARIPATGPPDGVLAFQFPIDKINRLMTFNKGWARVGMGRTGETVLGGPDYLMRSDSRLFLEDPQAYKTAVVDNGTAPDIADDAIRQNGTTLIQPLKEEAQLRAEKGEIGTLVIKDYLGQETLQAYAPVSGKDWNLHWTIVAKISAAEAFESAANFTRTVVLTAVAITFGVCLLAIVLAQIFIRPIRLLEAGSKRIAAGDLAVNLPVETRDEIGDLTQAFNEMSEELRAKDEVISRQRAENNRLLASLVPEAVAAKLRDGQEVSAADHENVTVVFIGVDGLEAMHDALDADQWLEQWNALLRQFDLAAAEFAMEPVRAVRNGYLATCGLGVPRLDAVVLGTQFARECYRIVERFNTEAGTTLTVRAGIDTGTVSSGMIGESPSVIFHIWGPAVSGAEHAMDASSTPGIYATTRVRDTLTDSAGFTSTGAKRVGLWRLEG